jgi:apolipoprotein N-acyltransferase
VSEPVATSDANTTVGLPPLTPAEEAHQARLRRIYLATGLSALLTFASFHPLDFGLLAFVALVPWIYVAATETRGVAVAMSYVVTFLYHLVGLSWIATVTPEGWLMTTFLEGFYGIAMVCGALWLRRRTGLPLLALLPPLGVALECVRGNTPFIHFPWLFMGHTQHAWDTLIQISDVTSAYGISFIVLLVNAAVVDAALVIRARWLREQDLTPTDLRRVGIYAFVPAAVVVLVLGYGVAKTSYVKEHIIEGPRALVVQVDIPQDLKDNEDSGGPEWLAEMNLKLSLEELGRLSREAAARGEELDIDVVVWSETMWPTGVGPVMDRRTAALAAEYDALLADVNPDYQRKFVYYRNRLFHIPREFQIPLLVGAVDTYLQQFRPPENSRIKEQHNSYYCIAPDPDALGGARVTARYDKMNLVPASEGIPFRGTWFFDLVKTFVPPGFTVFEPGAASVVMEVGEWKIAPNICFEISFAELLREHTKAGADVHVCPANDAWFMRGPRSNPSEVKPTAEIPLTLAHAKFRAIETRRGVIRCVNRGISCAIDPLGQVVDSISETYNGKTYEIGVDGTKVLTVPTTRLTSTYVAWGNWFPWLCGIAVALLALLSLKGPLLAEPAEEETPQGGSSGE